jgi:hypothetical protein
MGRALAREGGMPSALWAGPDRPAKPGAGTRLSVGFADGLIAYELRLGLPNRGPRSTAFSFDPEVKEETIRTIKAPRARLLERRNLSVMLRDDEGRPVTFGAQLDINESVLSQLAEPHRYPALSTLRERLRRWRFYHQARTDPDSPVRAVQIGTRTPVLAHDGNDLAAALQTIIENGNDLALADAVADAFEGAKLEITTPTPRALSPRAPDARHLPRREHTLHHRIVAIDSITGTWEEVGHPMSGAMGFNDSSVGPTSADALVTDIFALPQSPEPEQEMNHEHHHEILRSIRHRASVHHDRREPLLEPKPLDSAWKITSPENDVSRWCSNRSSGIAWTGATTCGLLNLTVRGLSGSWKVCLATSFYTTKKASFLRPHRRGIVDRAAHARCTRAGVAEKHVRVTQLEG